MFPERAQTELANVAVLRSQMPGSRTEGAMQMRMELLLVLLLVLLQSPLLHGGKLYVPPPTIFQAAEAGSHEVSMSLCLPLLPPG